MMLFIEKEMKGGTEVFNSKIDRQQVSRVHSILQSIHRSSGMVHALYAFAPAGHTIHRERNE